MDSGSLTLLLFPLVGIIFIALGIPLKLGKIPPNIWYGFRTPKTLSNETIWYEINRISGEDMIKIGVVLSLTALLILSLRLWISAEVAICLYVMVLLASVAWMAIRGFSILRKM